MREPEGISCLKVCVRGCDDAEMFQDKIELFKNQKGICVVHAGEQETSGDTRALGRIMPTTKRLLRFLQLHTPRCPIKQADRHTCIHTQCARTERPCLPSICSSASTHRSSGNKSIMYLHNHIYRVSRQFEDKMDLGHFWAVI